VQTLDQDETDFTKCLRVLEPFINELKIDHIVAICENSGRLDQIVANINTLFKNQKKSATISRPVFMLASTNLSWLLSAGQHEIHIPEGVRKMWCALMPVGAATVVSTEGLKWNMKDFEMRFGGLVSTSNKYDGVSEKVRVACDEPLLWSMGTGSED
jgi:thiamine pyrophosphokinase